MKKIISIIIGLVILFALGSVLFGEKGAETAAASAQVTVLEKTVLTGENKESTKEIEGDTVSVETGSYLKTGDKGRALIELGKAETVLDYNSEIILDTSKDGSSISLFLGATWSRVEKLFDKGEYHEIKTKNTVASVRGTSFGVIYAGDTTRLVVATGTVAFSERDEAGEVIATSTVFVSGGEEAYRIGFGPIIKTAITEKTKKEAWFIYNNTDGKAEVEKTESTPTAPKKPVPVPVTQVQTIVIPPPPAPAASQQSSGSNPTTVYTDYKFNIYSVSSESMKEGEETEVAIEGVGFSHITSIRVGDDDVEFDIIDDDDAVLILPANIDEGVYDIRLRGEGGRTETAEGVITVIWGRQTSNDPNAVR
jgi:hypothetical protein